MAIKITGSSKRLTATPNDVAYIVPSDCMSATIASGTVETLTGVGTRLNIKIVGPTREAWVILNKEITVIGAPLVLPTITLNRGEHLAAWSDVDASLDMSLTIGEQR